MGNQDTAQVLTILGILYNGFTLFFKFLMAFFGWPFMAMINALIDTLIWFVVGIILPIITYNDIPKGSRGTAGFLLILAGIISFIFIFFIGGVLLIVAGALVASRHPTQLHKSRNNCESTSIFSKKVAKC
ncbi:MAG: hypothetical protein ACFE89_03850 [Candidatus Hodarchaeota archaeon]